MVMEVVHEDVGEGNMQCINHQYKNGTPGGICAFCLQEKLGKLVSSSFPVTVFPSSSSSSTPSFRSDFGGSTTTGSGAAAVTTLQNRYLASSSTNTKRVDYDDTANGNDCNYHGYYSRRSRLPFILTHRRRKKKDGMMANADCTSFVFKRSKSTTTPITGVHFLNENYAEDYSPHRRGFWSFLYLSRQSTNKTVERNYKDLSFPSATPSTVSSSALGSSSVNGGGVRSRDKKREEFMGVEENGSPDESAFERKVSRSRSVGCGSRSFSGDFFERISTGFGDCTLRRVESQREGKSKIPLVHGNGGNNNTINGQDCIKERVKCGGIFSGFMIPSSSSSSSTEDNNVNGKLISETHSSMGNLFHGRSKNWGWAFASPMRAFGKPSTRKRVAAPSKNPTPNLAAIPSVLAVSG